MTENTIGGETWRTKTRTIKIGDELSISRWEYETDDNGKTMAREVQRTGTVTRIERSSGIHLDIPGDDFDRYLPLSLNDYLTPFDQMPEQVK